MNRNSGLPLHGGNNGRPSGLASSLGNFAKLKSRRMILLVALCILALLTLTRIFGSSEQTRNEVQRQEQAARTEAEREAVVKNILQTRKSAYSFSDFTEEGLVLPENEHLLPATAILLGWKRLEGLRLIVSYLARYPYIKEIIVWNNNMDVRLTNDDFQFDGQYGPQPELVVMNGGDNLHDLAKYMSCSLAKYEHCYFQDDDWLNTHMDSLYSNFLNSPNLIHTSTLPMIQIEHRRWSFTNEEIKMHTGFSWMGTGSFIPRAKTQRLLEQAASGNLAKDRTKVVDMYFSIWTNQYPYQLINGLTALDQKNGWSTEGVSDHWAIVFRNMLDAASRLYSALKANPEISEKDYFPRDEELPLVKDRHAKSPCHNDKCLFKSSIDPFPDPKEVVFNDDLQSIDDQNNKFYALDFPSNEFWNKFAFIHAVDHDPTTCWNSYKIPKAGDSFGLQMVAGTPLKRLIINSSKSMSMLDGTFSVMVSDHRGEQWVTCKHSVRFPLSHSMQLDLSCPSSPLLPKGMIHNVKIQFNSDLEKQLEVCGFGHATRVNQIITELLRPTSASTDNDTTASTSLAQISTILTDPTLIASATAATTAVKEILSSTKSNSSRHHSSKPIIYIVSDAPQFIFQDVIALGAIYRNAKVDAGVVQPLAYSVDRHQTISGVKSFLARRDEMIKCEVAWLAQVRADCVLADAPFLPCAAAAAYGIPACLITNFTFDEVYRFLREGDSLDKDVIACADAALEDYKKATLLLRLPGFIDIPSFDQEVATMDANRTPSISELAHSDDEFESMDHHHHHHHHHHTHQADVNSQRSSFAVEAWMGDATPAGGEAMSPSSSVPTSASSPNPSVSGRFSSSPKFSSADFPSSMSKFEGMARRVIDVPLVVRMAVNTREDVLRSLGVDEETIATKKMVLISFGGQRLKQGWGNPLPEGWIGVICGLPVEHELPQGFYRSPHGVYVPDLTRAADIVIGKLGYGTCSECIAHDTPLIYVSRPQFVEEQGLIKMMKRHGLPVEMTAEEFETGHWQRSILEADRQAQDEREGRRLFMESCEEDNADEEEHEQASQPHTKTDSDVTAATPLQTPGTAKMNGRRRSASVASLTVTRPKAYKMARLRVTEETEEEEREQKQQIQENGDELEALPRDGHEEHEPAVWFERRIPNNGGEVCARLIEEFMDQLGGHK
ncbi:hypothetical protein BG004_000725 [Podila humilis]|nr:hypothetical protein BG004_000725 [Podila humilis]